MQGVILTEVSADIISSSISELKAEKEADVYRAQEEIVAEAILQDVIDGEVSAKIISSSISEMKAEKDAEIYRAQDIAIAEAILQDAIDDEVFVIIKASLMDIRIEKLRKNNEERFRAQEVFITEALLQNIIDTEVVDIINQILLSVNVSQSKDPSLILHLTKQIHSLNKDRSGGNYDLSSKVTEEDKTKSRGILLDNLVFLPQLSPNDSFESSVGSSNESSPKIKEFKSPAKRKNRGKARQLELMSEEARPNSVVEANKVNSQISNDLQFYNFDDI
jgi:hypothetical protein